MIGNEFAYHRPSSLDELNEVLAGVQGSVSFLAGGTDVVPMLRDDAIAPDVVIDIKRIPGLGDLRIDDDTLHIGALVTFTEIIESEVVAEHAPLLAEMASTVASPGVRNRATLVGNICSAVPSCDAGSVLLAYDATIHLAGPGGERTVGIDDWFVGPRKTARTDDEIATHVTITLRSHAGVYVKLMRYAGEDLAQAAVAIVADHEPSYRVAFGALGPTPIRSSRIESLLHGRTIDDDAINDAVAVVSGEISPITDIRSTAEYRTHMTEVMLERGLRAAVSRLAGDGPAYGTRLV
ncbi:MAG: xanthine dehydrogenase family protein subunit M [Actinomycetota bacterium]